MDLVELLIGGIEVISRISAEWVALCEEGASNHPFLRPEWFTAFVQNFEANILLLTVRRKEKLRAVLPLVKKLGSLHGFPVRKLQAVFNLNTQRFDLVHGADEAERKKIVASIWKEIKQQANWHVMEMRLVDKDSWLNDLLSVAESEHYHTGVWKMDSAPFIRLPSTRGNETVDGDYFKNLNKHHIKESRRRLRRLSELGNVEFVVSREYSLELMKRFFDIEAGGWKGRAGTSVADDKRVEKLHDDFARAAAERNALLFYELKLNGKTIAMQLRLRYDQRTVCWKTTFDEAYARFSPGNLLFAEFLSECMRNGTHEVDLLCPPSASKKVWASGERELVGFYVFQRGLVGTLAWKWKFSFISFLRNLRDAKPI